MIGTGRTTNVIRIPSYSKEDFFRKWVEFLTPIHKLPNKEKDMVALLLSKYFELSKSVSNPSVISKILLSKESRDELRQECGMTVTYFNTVLLKLKKKGIIINKELNPKFIPKGLEDTNSSLQLLLYFDFDEKRN
jgi:hypothetical protein